MSALRKLIGTIMVLVFGFVSLPLMAVALALTAIAILSQALGKGILNLIMLFVNFAMLVGNFKKRVDINVTRASSRS